MGFLYQIEAKQKQLRQMYADQHGIRIEVATVTPIRAATEPAPVEQPAVIKRSIPTEQSIAITLPVSLHVRLTALMTAAEYKRSKREFTASLLEMVCTILEKEAAH